MPTTTVAAAMNFLKDMIMDVGKERVVDEEEGEECSLLRKEKGLCGGWSSAKDDQRTPADDSRAFPPSCVPAPTSLPHLGTCRSLLTEADRLSLLIALSLRRVQAACLPTVS